MTTEIRVPVLRPGETVPFEVELPAAITEHARYFTEPLSDVDWRLLHRMSDPNPFPRLRLFRWLP